MTREEAIEQLKQIPIHDGVSDNYLKTIYEAVDIAIKALEQQPCDDCVRREEALMALTGDVTDCTVEEYIARLRDKLSKLPSVGKDINVTTNEDCISRQAVLDIVNNPLNIRLDAIIKALPSVTPKKKTGHWIDNHTTCDCCGWQMIDDVIESPNMVFFLFCPNCGARMVEQQESEG